MTAQRKSFQTDVELPAVPGAPQTKEEWIKGAPEATRTPRKRRPWERHSKTAQPRFNFNLRLNDYQRELLEHAGKLSGRSMQQEAKHVLIGALEKALRGAKAEPDQSHDGAGAEP